MNEDENNKPQPEAEQTMQTEEGAPGLSEEATAEIETPEITIVRLETELADMKDKFLRTMAEVENARARHAREVDEARKYAATGFARDLLDVVDNLGRALASVPSGSRQDNKLLDDLCIGVEMTERTLLGAFDKHNIKKIEPAKGDKFDHKKHQAMFEVPTSEWAPGHVAEIMQPGYMISDRLLRAAMVGVSKALPTATVDVQETPPGGTVDTSA